MALKIRLTRMGRKKAPYYRIVVADSKYQRDGRFLEILGYYHPLGEEAEKRIRVDEEKTLEWLSNGAKPSETVHSMLSRLGIMKKFHEKRRPTKKSLGASSEQPAPQVST